MKNLRAMALGIHGVESIEIQTGDLSESWHAMTIIIRGCGEDSIGNEFTLNCFMDGAQAVTVTSKGNIFDRIYRAKR